MINIKFLQKLIILTFSVILLVLIFKIKINVSKSRKYNQDILAKVNEISNFMHKDNLIKLVDLLQMHTAYKSGKKIELVRLGGPNDGGYVVPKEALEDADALMSYGIADDNSFEESFSSIYNKHSYGFDCGIKSVSSTNEMFHFIDQCIGTDKYIYSHNSSSGKISSFSSQLKDLSFLDKKIFLKMDIEGAEYEVFDDILTYNKNITGIAMEVHFCDYENNLEQAISLLSKLNKDFILLHVHANNYAKRFKAKNLKGELTCAIELTYINKSLVTDYNLSEIQSRPLSIDAPNCIGPKCQFHGDIQFEILNKAQ